MKKTDHHYSGDRSRPFWARVNALPPGDQDAAYLLGCALQNLETFVLQQLAQFEQNARMKRK